MEKTIMKKVLLLSSFYYNAASANGICARVLVHELKKNGCQVYVIGYGSETSKVEPCENQELYTVKHDQHSERFSGKGSGWLFYRKIKSAFSLMKLLFSPLYHRETVDEYYKLALDIHKAYGIDMIIAMYFPIELVYAAWKVKKDMPDVSFLIYELDSATDGIQSKNMINQLQRKSYQRWEKKVYKYADQVFIMKSHADHVRSLYKNTLAHKVAVVDLPILYKRSVPECTKDESCIYFLYTGILDRTYRCPEYMLKIFESIGDEITWQLEFFSSGNCEEIIRKVASENDRIIQYGYVPEIELNHAIEKADFFISIGNSNSNSVPSKIISYMSYGKPIIHFSSQKHDICMDYLDKYPLSLLIDQNTFLSQNREKIIHFINENIHKRVPFELVEKAFPMNTPQYSVDFIMRK
jgi:glycosyltransferase involved in cell wall biosynthesis